jgi:ribosomal protein S18 acetylase RimI-like enzyme
LKITIRPFDKNDLQQVIQLTLLAFEPVFTSFERILGPGIYPVVYPDWRRRQQEGVEKLCDDEKVSFRVAEVEGNVVGYIAFELYEDHTAEVQLLAVHPNHQNRGIGTRLNQAALEEMKQKGALLAVVGTGGDPSHAPARASYEKAGYTPLPLVRYYKDL